MKIEADSSQLTVRGRITPDGLRRKGIFRAEFTEDRGLRSHVLAKGIHSSDEIGRILKEADGGDAGGAG
jgi:hypothetical protein